MVACEGSHCWLCAGGIQPSQCSQQQCCRLSGFGMSGVPSWVATLSFHVGVLRLSFRQPRWLREQLTSEGTRTRCVGVCWLGLCLEVCMRQGSSMMQGRAVSHVDRMCPPTTWYCKEMLHPKKGSHCLTRRGCCGNDVEAHRLCHRSQGSRHLMQVKGVPGFFHGCACGVAGAHCTSVQGCALLIAPNGPSKGCVSRAARQ